MENVSLQEVINHVNLEDVHNSKSLLLWLKGFFELSMPKKGRHMLLSHEQVKLILTKLDISIDDIDISLEEEIDKYFSKEKKCYKEENS